MAEELIRLHVPPIFYYLPTVEAHGTMACSVQLWDPPRRNYQGLG